MYFLTGPAPQWFHDILFLEEWSQHQERMQVRDKMFVMAKNVIGWDRSPESATACQAVNLCEMYAVSGDNIPHRSRQQPTDRITGYQSPANFVMQGSKGK